MILPLLPLFMALSTHPRESVSFRSFNLSDSQTCAALEKQFPPSPRQRRLCESLHVPVALYCFYLFKGHILRSFWKQSAIYPKLEFLNDFTEADLLAQDDSQYRGADEGVFTLDEKFFIYCYSDIAAVTESHVCVCHALPTLKEQCIQSIVECLARRKDESLRRWKGREKICGESHCTSRLLDGLAQYLPKSLIETLSEDSRFPFCGYHPEQANEYRSLFSYNPRLCFSNQAFVRKDYAHTKGFASWFQNDDWAPRHLLNPDTIDMIVRHYYEAQDLKSRFTKRLQNICEHCMKREVKAKFNAGIHSCFERYATPVPFTPDYFQDLIKVVQDNYYWCQICKRVPLFQILNEQQYREEYDPQYKKEFPNQRFSYAKAEYFI